MSELTVIPETTCVELLRNEVIGRVALATPEGPQIFPVNYAVDDDSVVFRTTAYSLLGSLAWKTRLAFEIDRMDYDHHSGWSVLLTGPGSRVDPGAELDEIVRRWNPEPWASGARPMYVRLRWDSISGRRVG